MDGLPLQETSHRKKAEGDPSVENSSSLALDIEDPGVSGRLFNKYLTFFVSVLQKCQAAEVNLSFSCSIQARLESVSVDSLKDHFNFLEAAKEHTILAASNLLSGNIEIGFKYCLEMGYKEDLQIRTAFTQVYSPFL